MKRYLFKTIEDLTHAIDTGVVNDDNFENFIWTIQEYLVAYKDGTEIGLIVDGTRFGWIDDSLEQRKIISGEEMDEIEKEAKSESTS